jgi:hypothetical protein
VEGRCDHLPAGVPFLSWKGGLEVMKPTRHFSLFYKQQSPSEY